MKVNRNTVGIIGCVLVGCALGAGCSQAGEPAGNVSTTVAAATGPATITTDAASYTYATSVVVTWSGVNGSTTDWIALAPAGSAMTAVTRWKYTGSTSTSGTLSLEGPVPGGSYVARAFDNGTYNLMGESDPFAVADASDTHATLALDQTDYAIDQPIVTTFTGMPPNAKDWVGISPPGSPDDKVVMWLYTGNVANGSKTFPLGLAFPSMAGFFGGNYVARLYLNDTYTKVAETAPVLIGSLVNTSAATYTPNQAITVNWTHMPGTAGDWVAIAPQGSPSNTITTFSLTDQSINGNHVFASGVANPGTYVARTLAPNTYYVSGESAPFTVTAGSSPTVTTDQASYNLGDLIVVTWSGLTTNDHDWIAIAPAGSPDTTVTRWVYTHTQTNGSFTFEGPPSTGTYVARAFFNDTYTKVGESASFTVN